MSTELIILLSFVVTIMVGVINALPSSFSEAAPKYSARLEKQIETGVGFISQDTTTSWQKPK